MDLMMLLGMIAGFALMIFGIVQNGDIMNFWNWGSVQITVFCTLAAGLMSYPFEQIKSAAKAFVIAFRSRPQNLNAEIDEIIRIANIARRAGLLALDEEVERLADPFIQKGIRLIVDGSDPQMIRDIMETELDFMQERHGQAQAVIDQLAAYSPAFGMLGTLVGLINMLLKMDDLSAVGPNMSVALVTTFYGIIMANMFYTPVARKLRSISSSEYLRKELLLEGLLSIQDGENPRIIKDKLEAFVARSELGAAKTKTGAWAPGKARENT